MEFHETHGSASTQPFPFFLCEATAGRRCIPESQVFLDAKTQTEATSDVSDGGSETADANSGDSSGSQGQSVER